MELAEAGGEIAECTHKHPLAFLPASLLTILLYKVVPMAVEQVQEDIDRIVNETLDILDLIYIDKYESEKQYSAAFYKKDGELRCTVKGSLEKVKEFSAEKISSGVEKVRDSNATKKVSEKILDKRKCRKGTSKHCEC